MVGRENAQQKTPNEVLRIAEEQASSLVEYAFILPSAAEVIRLRERSAKIVQEAEAASVLAKAAELERAGSAFFAGELTRFIALQVAHTVKAEEAVDSLIAALEAEESNAENAESLMLMAEYKRAELRYSQSFLEYKQVSREVIQLRKIRQSSELRESESEKAQADEIGLLKKAIALSSATQEAYNLACAARSLGDQERIDEADRIVAQRERAASENSREVLICRNKWQNHAQESAELSSLQEQLRIQEKRRVSLIGKALLSLEEAKEAVLESRRARIAEAARGEVVAGGVGVAEGEGAANVAGAGVVPNPEGAANVAGAEVVPNPVQSSERNGQQHRLGEALASIDNANKRLARRLLATVAIISIAAIGIGLTIMPLALLVIPISVIGGALYYFHNCEKSNGAGAQPSMAAGM